MGRTWALGVGDTRSLWGICRLPVLLMGNRALGFDHLLFFAFLPTSLDKRLGAVGLSPFLFDFLH